MVFGQSRRLSVLAATGAGFAAAVAQILLVRELLVLFSGNELSAGLIFAGWLLWTAAGSAFAGWVASRMARPLFAAAVLLMLLAVLVPLSLLLVRASRPLWGIPLGELPDLGRMVLVSTAATGMVCPVSGALFGFCWAAFRKEGSRGTGPLMIYTGEGAGAAAGGVAFYYFFFPRFTMLETAWITGSLMAVASAVLLLAREKEKGKNPGLILWPAAATLIASLAFFGPSLEDASRRWQWGSVPVDVCDTPYHNLALLRKDNQVSVFSNGLWLFSAPDPLSSEYAAHLALLQHPGPKTVLVLGGTVSGIVQEIGKHPGIRRIDCVEPDPELIPFACRHLPPESCAVLGLPAVRVFHQDPASFLYRAGDFYDAVLMNVGDPLNAGMNRFYTQEFFRKVQKRLTPAGVFSFAVSGGADMVGETQLRFLGSLNRTLQTVFGQVMIFPGDQARFAASDGKAPLCQDAGELLDRLSRRNIRVSHLREDTLEDLLSPLRIAYFSSILEQAPETFVNRDFFPICYFYSLLRWLKGWHPGLEKTAGAIAGLSAPWIWTALVLLGGGAAIAFRAAGFSFSAAAGASVFLAGGTGMALQLLLLLTFQILEGFVYLELSLIIACFMAGLAAGGGWGSVLAPRLPAWGMRYRRLLLVQGLMVFYPGTLAFLFYPLPAGLGEVLSAGAMEGLFCILSLGAGLLGGLHFSLAVHAVSRADTPSARAGAGLYALDLAGAAGGVLLISLFVLPLMGARHCLLLCSLASLAGFLILVCRSDPGENA